MTMQNFEITLPEGDIDAFIFDCDGTLGDTMPIHYRAWCAALGEHAADFPEAFFYELGGVPANGIIELLNERHGYNLPVKETADRKETFYREMAVQIAPIEPVVELVHRYVGIKPMAVASGGRRSIVTLTLSALGILDHFNTVVTCEDYTRAKPAPDPFLVAAERLGVKPERCVVFEDTNIGIEAAKAAGMKWVLVPAPSR
jgi:HAD superfamily hydrolase (TIGR01509 family)